MSRKTIRKMTAERRKLINQLVEILYNFLPLDAKSKNTVTYKSIFRESSVKKYLDGPDNKKQALQKGFMNIYRYHEKLLRVLIRKIVPAAIEYRKHKRYPLTQKELNELTKCLFDLSIDMTDELRKITIDETLPRITVPPKKLQENLRQHDLNSIISSEPLQLFCNGHYNEAVRKALEIFEDKVRDVSSIDASGRDLMGKAFASAKYLIIDGIEPENRQDFVDGYKFLAMGSMAAIRNIFSHGGEAQRIPEESFEMLLFINWLFRFVIEVNQS